MKNLRFAICDLRVLALLAAVLIPACAPAQVRQITRTNDVKQLPVTQDAIYWFAGEAVQYDIYARNGRSAVTISNSAVPIWYVTDSTLTNYFVFNTGTVVSATNGHVRFTLTPTYSALTSKLYQSAAIVYFQGPTNPSLALVVDRTAADVRKSFSYFGVYRGPVFSTNGVLDANTAAFPTFWSANATSIYAAISNQITVSGSSPGLEVLASNGVQVTQSGTNRWLGVTNSPLVGGKAESAFARASSLDGLAAVFAASTTVAYITGGRPINVSPQCLDFRSTDDTRAALQLYRTVTNGTTLNGAGRVGLTLWSYNADMSANFAAGDGAGLDMGPHSGNLAVWASRLLSSARGTNNYAHDLLVQVVSPVNSQLTTRAVFTTEGDLVVSNTVRAGAFVGDGSGLTNLPSSGGGSGADTNSVGLISTNAVNQSTNLAARLASNVWAVADSTTNYVRRTEGMTNNSFSINGVPVGSGSNITVSGGSGSGADTNSVGLISTNAVNQSTNLAARLASNVWAAADSTTNYVRRTGGTYTTADAWQFDRADGNAVAVNDAGVTLIGGDGGAILDVGAGSSADITALAGRFAGDGSGLTGLQSPLTVASNSSTFVKTLLFASDTNSWEGFWFAASGLVTQRVVRVGGLEKVWP